MAQIVIVVDAEVLREFKAECLRRGLTPTKEYGRLLADQVAKWLQEKYPQQERQ